MTAMLVEFQLEASNLKLSTFALSAAPESPAAAARAMGEASFSSFYHQTARPLFGYLLRISGQPDIAEEVCQEAYFRFLSAALPPMDCAGQRAYLFRIASNLLRDRWRRVKEEPLPDALAGTASTDSHPERRAAVRQAFGRLRLRERQLLWLAYVEGSSHQEIAECTGLRAASIRTLLFRARRKLARLLSGGRGDNHPSSSSGQTDDSEEERER